MTKKKIRMDGPFAEEKVKSKDKKRLREENQKEKGRFTEFGSEQDKKELEVFQKEIDRMNIDMINFHARGQGWLKENEGKQKGKSFEAFNDVYQRRMLLMCILPLQRGINAQSLIQSVGMTVGMAIANKDFRQNLHQMYANYQIDKAGGPNMYMLEAEKNPKLVNSINKHLLKANDGRIPYTEQSAAAMNIAFAKRAYEDFRNPEMDDFDVGYNYQRARDTLYELAKHDGISREDLDKATRMMYGRLSAIDPSLKYIYQETAYREVVIGDMEEDKYIQYDEYGNAVEHERDVWNGQFGDVESQQEFEGMFNIREKLNMTDFNNTVRKDIAEHLRWIEPENLEQSANAFSKVLFDISDKKFPNDLIYHEKMANHLTEYFGMGAYDGLPIVGEFNTMNDSIRYYNQTNDNSKMGMLEMYYVSMSEALKDYASQSPEHMRAVQDWGKNFRDHVKASDKTNTYQRRPANDTIHYDDDNFYDYGI